MVFESTSLDDFVPTIFIATVEDSGLKELANKLRRGEYAIAEVSDALAEYPALLTQFAHFVQDWRTENGHPDDERPDSPDY